MGDVRRGLERGDPVQHRLDRRGAGGVDLGFVHAGGVHVANQFFDAGGIGLGGGGLRRFLLAASERSVSISKLPQVVRSFGIGLAASHLLLTKSARLSQTFLLVSRSAMEKAAVGGRSAAGVGAAGAAVVAGAAGAAGAAACCCPGQPVSAAVTARDNNSVLGLLTITLDSGPSGGSVDKSGEVAGSWKKGGEWREGRAMHPRL